MATAGEPGAVERDDAVEPRRGSLRSDVLAIDASERGLAVLRQCLAGVDFRVTTAGGPRRGLDLARERSFDLVLVAADLPRLDGLAVCQRLQADPRHARVPVVLIGERSDAEARARAFAAGAADWLDLPLDRDEVRARLRVILRTCRRVAELEEELRGSNLRLQHSQRQQAWLRDELAHLRRLRDLADRRCHLLVDHDGRVHDADRGAAERLGAAIRGRRLAELTSPLATDLARFVAGSRDDGELDDGAGSVLEVERSRLLGGASLVVFREVGARREIERALAGRQPARPPVLPDRAGYRIPGLIGESTALHELRRQVDALRHVRSTVLVCGETGTGKEIVARALHFDGGHGDGPFVPIHCGAISPELIESELFGHEKGAFTGAMSSKEGLFAAADGGTVFLDEVAETSRDLQVKLLRVLQLGEIRPVGATRPRHVDVKIIAATNRELRDLVGRGLFRADLFYRLDVVTVRVPPLRERPEDIALLVDHFVRHFNRLHGRHDRVIGVSGAALRLLQSYPWPGNVRELENAINAAFALGCGSVIQESDLPPPIRAGTPGPPFDAADRPEPPAANAAGAFAPSLRSRRAHLDRAAFLDAIARADGDKRRAARELGLARSTFYRRLRELGLS